MHWIDGHLDLAYLGVCGRDLRRPCPDPAVGCLSLPALREANVQIAFATIFTEPGAEGPGAYPSSDDLDAAEAAGLRQLAHYERLEAEGELSIVRTREDLEGDTPLPRIVLLMEGADPVRSPEKLAWWHERGLRLIGLTWAMGTRYAGGNSKGGPLTPLGREMIAAMDELGMVHDVSHLGDEAFDELLDVAKGPVVATHSNCRALVNDVQRHLLDDQIARLTARNGIIGLNLFTRFIVPEGRATVREAIDHVERIADIAGRRDCVALGSDMDGGFTPMELPQVLMHPSRLRLLADELRARGWNDRDIAGFAHDNWERLLRQHLPAHARAIID
ncbi:MAG TPA: membrane dipeptidase [Phycisphaerales bacterium]|nr:membrane dipeptidase [Phycisphaerales bacterium]HRQ74874.1 membrane dipeptidase [Phycisphaerales bacterium]